MVPQNLKYADTHEWALIDEEINTVTVGLTAHAIEQLGDVVYVELPEVGREISKGEMFGAIESVKAASDIYAPVSGKIVEVNEDLPNDLDALKNDAYGAAWLIKIEPSNISETEKLLTAEQYEKICD